MGEVNVRHAGRSRNCIAIAVVFCVPLLAVLCRCATAQFFSQVQVELNDALRVDEPSPMVRVQLERVRVNIAERQWDEGIEGLRQLMENEGSRMVRLDTRFVSLREMGHMELVKLPAEGLKLYRGRVDHQAQKWYEDGLKNRDATLLNRVVDEFFASTFGDDALLAVGEIALERGEFQRARDCWERISPQFRSRDGLPLWIEQRSPQPVLDESSPPAAWLAYPDTDLNLATVRARLVMLSIMEGARARAEIELRSFVNQHPAAKGRLAGRDDEFQKTLAALLGEAQTWPAHATASTATTFGGDSTRNWAAPGEFRLPGLAWPAPIPLTPMQASKRAADNFGLPLRVAEELQGLLSYHPLIAAGLVIVHDLQRVYVYDLRTGKPAWEQTGKDRLPGQIYPLGRIDRPQTAASLANVLGAPRFTAMVDGTRLFVRLGSQVTSWPDGGAGDRQSRLVVLDLAQQGKLLAEIVPDNERWSFEGPPVCDGSRIYVAMRLNDVRPQAHVACYELTTSTGSAGLTHTARLRWRTMVCAAESPARGVVDEITHNLLTFAEGTLYLNTNLGAVASLSADDGRIRWLSTYPRARGQGEHAHLFRDLNPCVYDRGTLYVAPTDSPQIFALDAATGLVRWASRPSFEDVVHLLGVAHGNLIASGRNLWWLDAQTGKMVTAFPEPLSAGQVRPVGRGLLVGEIVVWPTRELLYVFQQQQVPSQNANAMPAMRRDPIRLADYGAGLSGGNLVAGEGYLLIATADNLWAFGPKGDELQMTKASPAPAAAKRTGR